ncbi:MAG: hypothetical protein ACP5OG_03245 [Candidatus Nanoarchaeia archaeon]
MAINNYSSPNISYADLSYQSKIAKSLIYENVIGKYNPASLSKGYDNNTSKINNNSYRL